MSHMGLPKPETQGHASAQGARVAVERGDVAGAVSTHLAHGTADVLVTLEARVAALEAWAEERGYEPPALPDQDDDDLSAAAKMRHLCLIVMETPYIR